MRILVCGVTFPPDGHGGYEAQCAGFVARARARGQEVRVLTAGEGPLGADRDADVHRTLRRFPARPQPTSAEAALRAELRNALVLHRHLRAFRPDVVSWWRMGELSASLVGRVARAGVPAVAQVSDPWPLEIAGRDPWARRRRHAFTVPRGAVAWRFVSRWLQRRVAGGWLDAQDVDVRHAGIDPGVFSPRPQSPPWRWRLVFAGRLSPLKGADLAIRALADLPPEATLDVLGDGPQRGELERLADRVAPGRVRFAGAAPPTAVADAMRAADAALFCPRWSEPWGLVPLEAMSCGVPLVAAATGGSTEHLRDGCNALLVGREAPAALAAAVHRLAAAPALRAHLVEGGLRTAAEHPADRWHDALLDDHLAAVRSRTRGQTL